MFRAREVARDALLVAAVKIAVSAAVIAQGFRALSDDDYARVVIAQRFVAEPSFDPSGTSWLPFPFWVHGAVMALLGREPMVARGTAIALGVLGALLVWISARWLGASRRGSLLGALLACAFPYSAWLGAATVPEAFTAALVVFGGAALSMPGARRVLGAVALCAACLSRYEAWPAAVVFAALSARDAIARRAVAESVAVLVAVAAPAAWMIHGLHNHGDAVFFLTRVAAYRRALGGPDTSLVAGLFGYPLAIVRCEPELIALCAIGLGGIRIRAERPLVRYRRLLLLLTSVLAFLVVGDVFDGAPTHHAERAVLAIWFGAAIFAGDALVRAAAELEPRERRRLALGGAAAILLCAGFLRPWFARRDSFIDRENELSIGRSAHDALDASDRLGILTPDFGFFAVIAGFSAPERAVALDEHDPRKPRPAGFTPELLAARLNQERASWLIVSSFEREALSFGAISVERGNYVLMRVNGR